MRLIVKICLILFGIAYLVSPIDIIPDLLLPYLGWVDDGAVIWVVYHLIRYGKLPWSDKERNFFTHEEPPRSSGASGSVSQDSGPGLSAYEVLGVSSRASWQEIQTAYREQSKKYHPDRVSHLGEEFSQLANEKFIEIQKAYEHLKQKKGK